MSRSPPCLLIGPVVVPAGPADVTPYVAQGIFPAFCAIPKGVRVGDPSTYTSLPTPCLGGRESTDGSARRITDTATGTPGTTIPYQKGGSTRAGFTATNLRLYDQNIPVHFAPAAR